MPIFGTLNASVLYPKQSYLSATGLLLLYHLDEDERRTVMDDYFKMIVVRHPLDRLRSTYTNKMKQAGTLNRQVLHKHQNIVEQFLQRNGKLAAVAGWFARPDEHDERIRGCRSTIPATRATYNKTPSCASRRRKETSAPSIVTLARTTEARRRSVLTTPIRVWIRPANIRPREGISEDSG
ncbi:hypothetical protein LSH36_342g01044 [Paralvinella palmiformis]|uniref:Sulfotransferase family protein n=1 Tax=Paralvinella palmiformis TaxID=53620 RepID=A0AAD9N2N3_9ANNE|nr:hypothetical protein LSH36_342g01044 [Paralvinella palmiformis]